MGTRRLVSKIIRTEEPKIGQSFSPKYLSLARRDDHAANIIRIRKQLADAGQNLK